MPDLAFSENAFLRSRRAQPEERTSHVDNMIPGKKTRQKSTKAADTEAEISRYFISAKASSRDASRAQKQSHQQEAQRQPPNQDSPPAFIDLPNKPFLGFGSCGVSISPVRELDSRALESLERRLTGSPTGSTSYFTWSQSGIQSQASLQRGGDNVVPLETSRYPNCRRRSPGTADAKKSKPPHSSPKARILSRGYRDAATRTTPPSQHCSHAPNPASTPGPPKDKRSGLDGDSREHGKIAEASLNNRDQPPEPMEATSVRDSVGDKAPRQIESALHKPLPKDTIRSFELMRGNEGDERDPHGSMAGCVQNLANPPPPSPLDTVLERLLQENKNGAIIDGRLNGVKSPGRPDSDPDSTLSPHGSPPMLPQHTNFRSHTGKACNASLPLEYVATGLASVDGHTQQHHNSTNRDSTAQKSPHIILRHSMRPPSKHSTMDYVVDRLQSSQRSTVDSRSAWNGYNTIYERQQHGEGHVPIERQACMADYNDMKGRSLLQPSSLEDTSAYGVHGPGNRPMRMKTPFNDHLPCLFEGQDLLHDGNVYADQGALQTSDWAGKPYSDSTWNSMEEPSLFEPNPGDHSIDHDSASYHRHTHAGCHNALELTIDRPTFEHRSFAADTPADTRTLPLNFASSFNSEHSASRQHTAIAAEDQSHDQGLSNFWTPHKLY